MADAFKSDMGIVAIKQAAATIRANVDKTQCTESKAHAAKLRKANVRMGRIQAQDEATSNWCAAATHRAKQVELLGMTATSTDMAMAKRFIKSANVSEDQARANEHKARMQGASVWSPSGNPEDPCEGKECIAMEDWLSQVGLLARKFAEEPCPPIPDCPSPDQVQYTRHKKNVSLVGNVMQLTHTNQYHVLPCVNGQCNVVERAVVQTKPLPAKPSVTL